MREEISAPGREVTLEDGRTTIIRYGFSSMAILEKEYGSLTGLFSELEKADKGAIFSVLGFILWAGTKRKLNLETFLDMLDMKRVEEYSLAVQGALTEALGSNQDEPGKQEAGETSAEI